MRMIAISVAKEKRATGDGRRKHHENHSLSRLHARTATQQQHLVTDRGLIGL